MKLKLSLLSGSGFDSVGFMSKTRFQFTASGTGLPPYVGVIPFIFSVMFFISLAYYEANYFFFGQTTIGVIVHFERPLSTTFVIVRFQDAQGRDQTIRQTLHMREAFEVGQSVRVRYVDGESPRGRIETFWQYWHPLLLKPTLGTLSLAAAIALFRRRFFGLSEPRKT